jgi:hypothetical protein
MLFAKLCDRSSVDELHRQVEFAVLRNTAVQQPSDVRVIEGCENLPLLPKAFSKEIAREWQVDELNRDLLLKLAVIAMRKVNRSHSTSAQQPVDLVRPKGAPRSLCLALRIALTRSRIFHPRRHLLLRIVRCQQRLQLRRQRGIARTALLKSRRPKGEWRGQYLMKERLGP